MTKRQNSLSKEFRRSSGDPDRQFFFHQFAFDELNGVEAYSLTHETGKYAGSPHGREEIGFVPWQFNLPDQGYEEAWKFLMDEDYFYSEYGPTTTEQQDPMFKVYEICCKWSGNSWPYATTQTLVAMANLLHNYEQHVVSKEDYFELLKIYAKTQHKNGRPYIAEAANPFTGSWEGHDNYYHSEHYLHSGYINNVITGLVGLRPQAGDKIVVDPQIPESWDYFALEDVSYHGHNVSIVWDREGNRYGKGIGLMLFVDGKKVANSDQLEPMEVAIDPVPDKPLEKQPVNFAVNNEKAFSHVSASSTHPEQTPYYAVDGNYWYHQSPANRWISTDAGNQEWIHVDFGVERPVEEVKLYFLDDGNEVRPPEQYQLQVWDGEQWNTIEKVTQTPAEPTGHRPNTIQLDQVYHTEKVKVVMDKPAGQSVGLTEIEVWGHDDLPLDQPVAEVTNLAFNPDNELFPIYSASYTHPGSQLGSVSDMHGLIPYNDPSRWSAPGITQSTGLDRN
ncbi:MAG: discoidin domain-containing protein [Balneolaceae bacterium]|nr:discoidin domain-containing protein [Balneolaceae bacterium]